MTYLEQRSCWFKLLLYSDLTRYDTIIALYSPKRRGVHLTQLGLNNQKISLVIIN